MAILATALAVYGRWMLGGVWGEAYPFILFCPAIVLAAAVGGTGPGLAATALAAILGHDLFASPHHLWGVAGAGEVARLLALLFFGGLMSLLVGRMYLLRQRAEGEAHELADTQSALRRTRDTLQLALDAANTGTWDWDIPAGKLAWSERCLAIYGLPPQTPMSYQRFLEAVHPEDRAAVDAAVKMALERKRDYHVEMRALWPDGGVHWVSSRGRAFHGPDGRPLRMSGTAVDITPRKEAEAALRRQEQQFRGTFENAAVGITHIDRDGRWLRINPRLCQMLGYTEQELKGLSFLDFTCPEDREEDLRLHQRLMAGELENYSIEKRYVRKDGRAIWVRVTRSAQHGAKGGASEYSISIIEDITGRKRAEEAAEAARQSAEKAKMAAEQANQAKDHFLAVLSHELRTPLTPVVAAVSMLEHAWGGDERMREMLEMIRRNVEMEARLIDDLLDMTRIARGKVELHRHPVAICTVLERAAEVCMPDIEARRLHFGLAIKDRPLFVNADAGRMQQVFWNLIKNSVKFTPHGGRIGIRCWRENDTVIAEVTDSGVGIQPEALARIFNAFEQAERSITRQFGGLGLGLTISKALVEMHGGSIEAYSEGRNKGSTFRVRLPLESGSGLRVPGPGTETPGTRSPEPGTRPLRILLVEDHGDTARIMKRLLMADGHQVQAAGDAATALELAGRESFDLIISDLGLPDASGLELMRELRRRGDNTPGIALSGYGQEQDVQRSREAGFAEHLTKPTSPERLAEAIAFVSGRTPAAR